MADPRLMRVCWGNTTFVSCIIVVMLYVLGIVQKKSVFGYLINMSAFSFLGVV